jgi:hypothetical protein
MARILANLTDNVNGCADDCLQGTLMSATYRCFLLTRQIFYELCTDELYKDCLVHDPVAFFRELDISKPDCTKRRQVSKLKTLRICHSTTVDEPTYIELLNRLNKRANWSQDAWNACGSLRYPHDPPVSERQRWNRLMLDFDGSNEVMHWLRMMEHKGQDVLNNLERVVMKGMEDDLVTRKTIGLPKGLADILATQPNVKYYCQSSLYGPLTLSGMHYQPLHPPKIVTLHISQTPKIWEPRMRLPVVIGATNRYICANPVKNAGMTPSTAAGVSDKWIQGLSPLIEVINKDGNVVRVKSEAEQAKLVKGEDVFDIIPFDSANLEGTTIELYNFVCDAMTPARNVAEAEALVQMGIFPEYKPLRNDVRQAIARQLDKAIHPKWRGRIVFRNLDEIPLCPACQIPDTAKLGY